jgi:hypothetical protein
MPLTFQADYRPNRLPVDLSCLSAFDDEQNMRVLSVSLKSHILVRGGAFSLRYIPSEKLLTRQLLDTMVRDPSRGVTFLKKVRVRRRGNDANN